MGWKEKRRDGDEPYSLGWSLCIKETDGAILIEQDNMELWIPKSCLHDDSDVCQEGDLGEAIVKLWWAEDEGL